MKRIIIVPVLIASLFSSLLYAESHLWRNLATESDWNATLERINLVSGQYVEARKDPICLGKEPLFYHAFFSSFLCKEWQGGQWEVMPHLILTNLEPEKNFYHVHVKDTNGTQFYFSNESRLANAMMFNQAIEGTSNTARGEISSKTNLINASLSYDPKAHEFTLYLPNGARRIYQSTGVNRYKDVGTFLHKEIDESFKNVFSILAMRLHQSEDFSQKSPDKR